MIERCRQCDELNSGGEPYRIDGSPGVYRDRDFECENCGATGVSHHHSRAGIVGYWGSYFGKDEDDRTE